MPPNSAMVRQTKVAARKRNTATTAPDTRIEVMVM